MEKDNKKTYWPHMIIGFLAVGITLGYWTVKSASSIPVQEVNDYMMKYQQADLHINDIIEHQKAFDKAYTIELQDIETMVMTDNVNSKRAQPNPVKLSQGMNAFKYSIKSKNGTVVKDANVTFLLTRPHTQTDDQIFKHVTFETGAYVIKSVQITKPGRYTLQLRAQIDDKVGFMETPAYLKP